MSLATMPLWILGTMIVVVPTMLAMAGPVIARRVIGLPRLATNNEVAGFKFATVGVLYAVLLAFVVIVVWEKFSDAMLTCLVRRLTRVALERHFAICLLHLVGGSFHLESQHLIRVDRRRAIFFIHVVLAFALVIVYKVVLCVLLGRLFFLLFPCHIVEL